ncbi:MAG: TonB-dependent receptor [Crocinitomicaceae bacterium]|nr:TonB-dependent receptor [Crocinitomicaceae bacterium]
MPICKLHIVLFMMGILSFLSTNAQDSLRKLPNVLVTETRPRIFVSDLNSPGPNYSLPEWKIKELGSRDVGEVMKFTPGAQIKDYGGIGGIKTIRFRSLGGAHTGVIVDHNTQFNTQVGTINLSSFETFALKAIHFTSGQPTSLLSMPSAYIPSSSIGIQTNQSIRDTAYNLGFYQTVTSINAYETGLNIGSPIGKKFGVGALLFAKYGDGRYPYVYDLTGSEESFTRENSRLFNYRARIGGGYFGDRSKVNFQVYYNKNNQQLPGAVILFNPSNDQSLMNEDFRADLSHFVFVPTSSDNGAWTIRTSAYAQSNRTIYEDPNFLNAQGFIRSNYLQHRYGLGIMSNRTWKSSRIFIGTDAYLSDLISNEFDNAPKRIGFNSVIGTSVNVGKSWHLEGNVTHQLIWDEARSADSLLAKRYSKWAPYIGVSVKPFKNKRLGVRSFYKKAFRMPTFNDLYYNFIGNTNLKPEEAHQFNFGLNYQFDLSGNDKKHKNIFEFSIDGFYNQVKNKIVAVPTKDLFNWSMQNIGKTRVLGTDIGFIYAQGIAAWNWNLTGSLTVNQSVDVTNPESSSYGHQIPYTPLLSGNTSLSIAWKGYTLTNNVLYTGQRYSLNENIPMNYMEPFVDWNIGISKLFELPHHNRLYVSLKTMNVLNKNYEVIRSFPMPGRYYQITLKYNYK